MKALFAILAVSVSVAIAGIPWVPEPVPGIWMDWHSYFVNYSRDNYDDINVLFYGDSITWMWYNDGRDVYDEYYAPLGTANYGIPGDRTEHVLWRIKNGEVIPEMHPKVCVLKIGTNNILENDPTAIATGITFIVLELRERLPDMKILLLGILPRNNEQLTNRTSAVNEVIKHLDNGDTIRYLDMGSHFYNGGGDFNTELYTDMLHLSEAGYQKWAEVMDPLFQEMLNS